MKGVLLTLSLMISLISFSSGQNNYTSQNPLDFWFGEWIQKTLSMDPAPANDNWKSEVVINEFIPILDGQGAHRVIMTPNQTIEGYFFYDSGAKKIYGNSIDTNGYLWQTEYQLDKQGKITGMKGGAVNDKSQGIESKLEIVDDNEIHFTQYFTEKGKVYLTIKGMLIRIPG